MDSRKSRQGFLSGINAFLDDEFLDDASDDDASDDDFLEDEVAVVDWIEALTSVIDWKFGDKKRELRADAGYITIDDFERAGHVLGRYIEDELSCVLQLDVDFEDHSWWIECDGPTCSPEHLCPHGAQLSLFLYNHLIADGFSSEALLGETVPKSKASSAQRLLAELDQYLADRADDVVHSEETDEEEVVQHRLTWKFCIEQKRLALKVLRSRPRKRGGGWTKGQQVSLPELVEQRADLVTSPADVEALKAIKVTEVTSGIFHTGREREYALDRLEAAAALVGHDRVMLNEQPATVRHFNIGLAVEAHDDSLYLRPTGCNLSDDAAWFLFPEGIIVCSDPDKAIAVCRSDEESVQLMHFLMESHRFPLDRVDDLRQRLNAISLEMAVEWPPSLAGPVVPETTTPIAWLQSKPDGLLDCEIRVRDRRGRFTSPGEGGLRYLDTEDGKPVQRQRDAEQERTQCEELLKRLELDRAFRLSPWRYRVLEYGHALQLLERLEAESESLEVAWDPRSTETRRILGSMTASNVRVEVSKKRDWFSVAGNCRIGDHDLPLTDVLQRLQHVPSPGYIEIRPGEWAKIGARLREQLQRLRDNLHRRRNQWEIGETSAPLVQDLLDAQVDLEAPEAWRDCLQRLNAAQELDPTPPESLSQILRDYQIEGYRWLCRLATWGVGGCLADDMGLGKTLQTLAVLLDRRQDGPTLVVAPTSVGVNWIRETERFAPELKPHLYRETERKDFLPKVGPGDLVVCSYGLALRDADALSQVEWHTLVLDEAQFVKNSRSKTSQAIRGIQADWRLALTGTPMENHLGELWSIFRIVSPGLFGSWEEFRRRFAGPIERDNDDERRTALSHLIRPFVLRRSKQEVLQDLPPRTEMNLYVDLSAEERRRYDEMRLAALGEIEQVVGMPDTQDQRFRVLTILTRLRQLSCHIGLVDKTWEGRSAKLDLLIETLQELRDEGHRALIFSQFTSHLALAREALDEAEIRYEYLDGSTPAAQRQKRVDAFQEGDADAFLISLKAGGTGLNLTGADYVIHLDPWWNPAVEDQATDRAHRIGQTRPVMVYRIVARGTVEEQILELHQDKRDLVSSVMDGTQSAARLSTSELVELIREGGT